MGQTSSIWVGRAPIHKHTMGLPKQAPVGREPDQQHPMTPEDMAAQGSGEAAQENASGVLMHSHSGHTDPHPVALRHRKGSADPLHGEEDKLVDEYKDLFEKAGQGMCTGVELMRLREIRGALKELQGKRVKEAQAIAASLDGVMGKSAAGTGVQRAVKPMANDPLPQAPSPPLRRIRPGQDHQPAMKPTMPGARPGLAKEKDALGHGSDKKGQGRDMEGGAAPDQHGASQAAAVRRSSAQGFAQKLVSNKWVGPEAAQEISQMAADVMRRSKSTVLAPEQKKAILNQYLAAEKARRGGGNIQKHPGHDDQSIHGGDGGQKDPAWGGSMFEDGTPYDHRKYQQKVNEHMEGLGRDFASGKLDEKGLQAALEELGNETGRDPRGLYEQVYQMSRRAGSPPASRREANRGKSQWGNAFGPDGQERRVFVPRKEDDMPDPMDRALKSLQRAVSKAQSEWGEYVPVSPAPEGAKERKRTEEPLLEGKAAYGKTEPGEGGVIPTGGKPVDRTESLWETPDDEKHEHVTLPDAVLDAPKLVTKAAALWTGYHGPVQQGPVGG